MKRDILRKRIDTVCSEVQSETDREKLLGLFRELDHLLKVYRGEESESRAPPISNYYDEAERYQPTNEDIAWARNVTNLVKHGGVVTYPATNLFYKLDHHQRVMTLENPEQLERFDSFVVHIQTVAVFELIGYTVNERSK